MRRVRYWQTPVILAALSVSIALADDFKTTDGKEYKNVTVSRVEPDGIVLKSSSGIVKIPFTELSPDLQKKYGYDSSAAAAYAAEEYQKQSALAQQRKAEEQRRFEERQKYWSERQASAPAAPQEQQSVAKSATLHGSALDQRPIGKTVLVGRVQHVDEGVLLRLTEAAVIGQDRVAPNVEVLLSGDFPQFYDDDRVQTVAVQTGMRDFVTLTSRHTIRKNVRVFDVIQIVKLPY